ncbi:glucan endo-1,3-beta-D-glucosidase [Winogradskyella pulchriflava]|uniref:Glucan endo-1,3-beta-D-glucosidase n=1 Tax=Winogradskyella pulchriflava TaxID=1110688 RepID=A0ABV6Q6I2_9FLAO
MKNFKYIIYSMVALVMLVTSCQKEDQEFGDITAPSNIQIDVDIVGADAANPNGDGSGVVNFTATADNAISYQYVYNGSSTTAPNGMATYTFATLGLNTYSITVVAYGTGGASSTTTIDVDVLSLYEPPADLITMLTADSSRTWRIKNEGTGHFGLGPIGGIFNEYYGAAPNDKAGVGMYDDRYIFNVDGTFTHITDGTNDDPTNDDSGTVFGREVLINELNGPGEGSVNGADIENYPYSDYSAQWTLTAPGDVETLSLTGIGFLGYYVGGSHSYIIESRSANEMAVRTTDGNGEFDWGFILIAE